jgi:hypothetical protein
MARVIQLMLVEAESAEDAKRSVLGLLEGDGSPTPDWSDYHDVVEFFDKEEAVPYSTTIGKMMFNEMVAEREAELKRYYDRVKNFDLKKSVENYDPFKSGGYTEDDFRIYEIRKIASILEDRWTMDSAVYDLETWSANLKAFRERCELAPEMQYLVAVSFHH